jgi:nucleoside-diphosphate-sugar epimerase
MGTVVVTGAGGFVGSAVTRRLVDWVATGAARFWDGEPVTAVCAMLRPSSSAERLETVAAEPALMIERVELSDTARLLATLGRQRPKAVLHLAFDPSGFAPQDDAGWRANHLAPLRAIFAALAGRTTRVVHTGSAWVLGAGTGLAEDATVAPLLDYARAKVKLDAAMAPLEAEFGVPWINLRLFNVFGRYEAPHRLLPHLVESLRHGVRPRLTHGDQLRDFNDVDDIAEAYRLALVAPAEMCGRLYHIGSGRGMTVRRFAEVTCEAMGVPHKIDYNVATTRDQDVPALVCDPSLAMERLGWRPNRDQEGRISAAVAWWLARPALQAAGT